MEPRQSGNIQRRESEAERARLIHPPERLLRQLQPFDFADRDLGIRRKDVVVFSAVATATETIILLRRTNPKSLPYVGVRGYVPKPIDCKAKTAIADGLIDGYQVECAGLVADPRVLEGKVFAGRLEETLECWRRFVRDHHRIKLGRGVEVFMRARGKGFYAVDTAPPSAILRHHACLLVSQQDVPTDFDPASSHTRAWMRQNMAYVHGDYDLYGIIDAAAIDPLHGVNVQVVQQETLLDTTNLFTRRTHEVQEMLNAAIGCDMVQHGEQVAYKFVADTLYVFAPSGGKWVIRGDQGSREMAGMLVDLFRYVFGTEIV